jgi:hypothetical protein
VQARQLSSRNTRHRPYAAGRATPRIGTASESPDPSGGTNSSTLAKRPSAGAGGGWLFDHLIGAEQERRRDREPEGLGGPEVDDQINFVGWITGRSAGLAPLRILPV